MSSNPLEDNCNMTMGSTLINIKKQSNILIHIYIRITNLKENKTCILTLVIVANVLFCTSLMLPIN